MKTIQNAFIRVHTLGQNLIEVGEAVVRPDAEVVFATLLILCAERGRRVERETVLGLLWPREPIARRRHNLRQVLYKLRQTGVDTGTASETLTIPKGYVWLDFEDASARDARKAVQELGAPGSVRFMPGFAPRISKQYTAWLETLRERVEGTVRRRLVDAIDGARRDGRWEDTEKLARTCLELDPFNEEATLALAEALALSGAKSKAISILDDYMAELGTDARDLRVSATILRRRIADRMATRRIASPLEAKLVGRDELMEQLTQAFEGARAGKPQVHLISGAPGIGKTRIAEEFAKGVTLLGGRTYTESAAPDDVQTPGLTLVRLLAVMMDAPGVLGLAPDVLSLLRQLTALAPGDASSRPLELSDDVLVRAVVDLERALAYEHPLVIVLDDFHHTDTLTRRVLSRAQQCMSSERVLFIGVGVDARVEGFNAPATRHVVPRLSESATRALAEALIARAGGSAEGGLVESFVTASGGHPFVLRETILAWLRDGAATESLGSVEATMQRRVSALSSEARDVLFSAIVLAEHATVPLVLASATGSRGEVERGLVELEHEQILRFEADGGIRTHSLWRSLVDTLLPVGLAVSRRHRIAEVLEEAGGAAGESAELMLASAAQFQATGDVTRAAEVLARGGAALKERALAPGAYAAFTRAAAMAPGSEGFDATLAHAVIAGWDARLAPEVRALIEQFHDHLQHSTTLPDEERAELRVTAMEVEYAFLSTTGIAESARNLLSGNGFTPRQRLRIAARGCQAADYEYAGDTLVTIADSVSGLQPSDGIEQHLVRQIAMARAIATGALASACDNAEEELRRIPIDLLPHDRPRPLLSARIPFWFNCDFDRVGQIIQSARAAAAKYSCTVDALRAEDVYATHCIEMLHLDSARQAIHEASTIAQTVSQSGLHQNLAELTVRLGIAADDSAVLDLAKTALTDATSPEVVNRHRTFALCNAAIALARAGDTALLPQVASELRTHWLRVLAGTPFDYGCVALAIGLRAIGKSAQAERLVREYVGRQRLARYPRSPLTTSLVKEFGIPWD